MKDRLVFYEFLTGEVYVFRRKVVQEEKPVRGVEGVSMKVTVMTAPIPFHAGLSRVDLTASRQDYAAHRRQSDGRGKAKGARACEVVNPDKVFKNDSL